MMGLHCCDDSRPSAAKSNFDCSCIVMRLLGYCDVTSHELGLLEIETASTLCMHLIPDS